MPKEEIAIALLQDGLDRGEEVALSTLGESMKPLLEPGQAFRVKRVPSGQIEIGDIVCLEDVKQVIVHRVVKIFQRNGERFFITKWDYLFALDKPVSESRILGRVVQIGGLRLDRPFQKMLARVVAHIFYWHYCGYHAFWRIPGMEFLGRLKQRFFLKKSIFTPLYRGLLWPLYGCLSGNRLICKEERNEDKKQTILHR